MKYKDGKFRGFAFIGYQTDAEAGAAKKYLDGTFVGAAIIKVEMCNELGESNKKKDKKKEKKESLLDSTPVGGYQRKNPNLIRKRRIVMMT